MEEKTRWVWTTNQQLFTAARICMDQLRLWDAVYIMNLQQQIDGKEGLQQVSVSLKRDYLTSLFEVSTYQRIKRL